MPRTGEQLARLSWTGARHARRSRGPRARAGPPGPLEALCVARAIERGERPTQKRFVTIVLFEVATIDPSTKKRPPRGGEKVLPIQGRAGIMQKQLVRALFGLVLLISAGCARHFYARYAGGTHRAITPWAIFWHAWPVSPTTPKSYARASLSNDSHQMRQDVVVPFCYKWGTGSPP